ncbi:MAG: L,D-transpeptidase family protein, partial [Hyphomicrobiaceae bacterium]
MSSIRNWSLAAILALGVSQPVPALANEPATTEKVDTSAPAVEAIAAPLLTLVRQRIGDSGNRGVDAQDRAALTAFYADANRTLLWVNEAGLTPRARTAITEIRSAADWGLNATSFETPDPQLVAKTPEALAAAEVRLSLAVLKYARHARGGRIDVSLLGRNFDQKPPLLESKIVIEGIAAALDADAYLRGLHPKHPQFEKLRQALLAARKPAAVEPAKAPGADVKLPAGPRITAGQSHAQVAMLRQRLNIENGETANNLGDGLATALREFQQSKGIEPTGNLDNITRSALNGAAKSVSAADNSQRILVNMERWRWLPENLGEFHVWDNIPEYRMRVLKDGKVVHAETIIVGKPNTPTPVFSADMKYVIFHPTWGVPDGIKVNEIAPSLRRSTGGGGFFNFGESAEPAILRRHNLKVSYNGRPIDPSTVNWSTADIRNYQFTQPAGGSNVLGVVKFRFPNKHDVYMHDTPERSLFSRAEKAFSHGCMRVQNPRRLAEVLLAEDKGWTSAQVGHAIASGATQDVTLTKQIPVHITYFTAMVEDDGRLKTFSDLYGHDSRIASALEGKSVKLIAQTDPAVRAEREVQRR